MARRLATCRRGNGSGHCPMRWPQGSEAQQQRCCSSNAAAFCCRCLSCEDLPPARSSSLRHGAWSAWLGPACPTMLCPLCPLCRCAARTPSASTSTAMLRRQTRMAGSILVMWQRSTTWGTCRFGFLTLRATPVGCARQGTAGMHCGSGDVAMICHLGHMQVTRCSLLNAAFPSICVLLPASCRHRCADRMRGAHM